MANDLKLIHIISNLKLIHMYFFYYPQENDEMGVFWVGNIQYNTPLLPMYAKYRIIGAWKLI